MMSRQETARSSPRGRPRSEKSEKEVKDLSSSPTPLQATRDAVSSPSLISSPPTAPFDSKPSSRLAKSYTVVTNSEEEVGTNSGTGEPMGLPPEWLSMGPKRVQSVTAVPALPANTATASTSVPRRRTEVTLPVLAVKKQEPAPAMVATEKQEKNDKAEKVEKSDKADTKAEKSDKQAEKKKKKLLLREMDDLHRELEEMKSKLSAKTSAFERLQEQWWQNVGVDTTSEPQLRVIQAASACANASLGLDENLKIMLAHGADIMLPTPQTGRTALHCAAAAGHARVVTFLIDSGAQLESKDLDGRTAFDVAASTRHYSILQQLDEARAYQSFKAIEKEYKLSDYMSSGDERMASQKVEKVAIQRQISKLSRFFGESMKKETVKTKESASSTPSLFSTGTSLHAIPVTGRSTPAMITKSTEPVINSGSGGNTTSSLKSNSLIHSTPPMLSGKHGHPIAASTTKDPKKEKDHAYHQTSSQKSVVTSGGSTTSITIPTDTTSTSTTHASGGQTSSRDNITGASTISASVAESVDGANAPPKERRRKRDKGAIRRLIDWTKGRTAPGMETSADGTSSEETTTDTEDSSARTGNSSLSSSSPQTSSNRSSSHASPHGRHSARHHNTTTQQQGHQPRTPRVAMPGAGVAFGVAFGRMRGACQSPNCHCLCFHIDAAAPGVQICTCKHFPATHEDLGEANNLVVESGNKLTMNILEGLEHLNITDEKDLQVLVEKDAGVPWPKILNPALEDDMVAQLFSGVFTREDLIVPSHDIEFLKKLGQGASATVYLGVHKSRGTRLAIKVIDMFPTGSKSLAKIQYEMTEELRVMSALSEVSDHVVRFYGVISQPRLCILLEFCSHGTMTEVLQNKQIRLDWPLYFKWVREICRGIFDLHNWSPPIVHRDLKTLNLLVDDQWHIKVADFGLSRFLAPEESQTTLGKMRGTYAYTDPEIYDGVKFSTKADMYSLGIILWELTYRTMKGEYLRPYGEYPFMVRDYQIIIQVARKDLRPTIPERTPAPIANIIRSLWAKNPATPRPTAAQLLDMFDNIETQVYANAKSEWDSTLPPIPSDVPHDSVIYIDPSNDMLPSLTATTTTSSQFVGGSSLSTSSGSSWSGLAQSSSAENLSSSSSARPSPRLAMTPVSALALSSIPTTSSPRGFSSQSSPSSSPSSLGHLLTTKDSFSSSGNARSTTDSNSHFHLLAPATPSSRDDGTSAPTSPRTEGDSSADYVPERTSFDMNAVSSDSLSSPVTRRSTSAKKHHARSKSGAEEIPMLGALNSASGKPGTTSVSLAAIEGVSGPATARASTRSSKSHRLDKEKEKQTEKEAAKVAKETRADKDKHHHKKRDKA